MKIRLTLTVRYLLVWFILICLFSSLGCETLRKKFTRKPKSERESTEEVIYEPQAYPVQVMSNEEMYRLYYAFWAGWQQELIEVLAEGQNHKKQIECITEIVKNLEKMKNLLVSDYQPGLQAEINKLLPIKEEIVSGRSNASNFFWMKMKLGSINTKIAKDYLPRKIKPYLIK